MAQPSKSGWRKTKVYQLVKRKYAYEVHTGMGSYYYSSWLKAFKFCQRHNHIYRGGEWAYVTEMHNGKGSVFVIFKHRLL